MALAPGLRAVARRLGVERQALYFRRLFLPQHVRADIRDSELSALDDETPHDRAEFVQGQQRRSLQLRHVALVASKLAPQDRRPVGALRVGEH